MIIFMDFLHGKHLKCFETLISSIQKLWLYWFKHSTKQWKPIMLMVLATLPVFRGSSCFLSTTVGRMLIWWRWMHLNNGFLNQLLCIENPLNTTVARIEEPLQCNMHLAKCIPMHCTHSDSGQYSMLIFQSIPSIQIWFISAGIRLWRAIFSQKARPLLLLLWKCLIFVLVIIVATWNGSMRTELGFLLWNDYALRQSI